MTTLAVTRRFDSTDERWALLPVAKRRVVRAMAQYNSFGTWGWLDTIPRDVLDHVEVILGDVRDPASTQDLIGEAEVVYHLAALIAIPYSYRAPHSYVGTRPATSPSCRTPPPPSSP